MRVLWVTNDLPPQAGGIEQFVGNLLLRAHPETTVVVGPARADAADHDRAQPYQVVRAPGRVLPTPAVLELVRRVAADHRPDVVVLGAAWPLGELAPALRDDPGAPVVGLTHGLEAGLVTVGLGHLVGRATRGCAAVTAISAYTERRLRRHADPATVTRLPPGVDPSSFRPGRDGHRLRGEWGVPHDALVVGCISRLVRRKGQDVLLRAWPQVQTRHPDAWLVLAGAGPLSRRLRHAARDIPRVVVPGALPWEDLPDAHAALDVFAMPCRTRLAGLDVEGLGIVYLEAQATGVPVLAGRSGGAPEAVRHGETGLVVDGAEPAEVAGALDQLLSDAALRTRMGAAGTRWVARHWTWDAIAARFRDLLATVVG